MKKIFIAILLLLSLVCIFTGCNITNHTHSFDTYVDYDAEYHYKVCSTNNSHMEKEKHVFDDGIVISEATESSFGFREYKCIYCGRKKTEKIPMIGDTNYTNKVVDEKYLKARISDATSIYYMSSDSGTYGDDERVFEYTVIPDEYTEVEYIESDGKQHIDTGVVLNNNSSVELDFMPTALGNYFGAKVAWDNRAFTLGYWNTGYYAFGYGNNGASPSSSTIPIALNVRTTFVARKNVFSVGNYSYTFSNTSAFTCAGSAYLFSNNPPTNIGQQRVYKCKIWDDEVLVRNFIPVVRDVDGIAGMYDIVGNRFYASITIEEDTTDNFVPGNVVYEKVSLPKEYTQVAYIETDGTQYIDTGFKPDPITTKYETVISFLDVKGASEPFGSRNGSEVCLSSCNAFVVDGNLRLDWVNAKSTVVTKIEANKVYNIFITANYASVNDVGFIDSVKTRETSNYNFYIGALNNHGNGEFRFCKCKIYSAKLYDNDILVRDFVPVVRNGDDVAGLYDLVNSKFYEKSVGNNLSYEFGLLGRESELPKEYLQLDYIQSTGTQYIDTGVIAKSSIDSEIKLNPNTIDGAQCYLGARVADSRIWALLIENGQYEIGQKNKKLVKGAVAGQTIVAKTHLYNGDQNLKIDDKLMITDDVNQDVNLGITMHLFRANYTDPFYANGKVYYCKLWDDGVLVRDYIPCVNIINGKVGLFDLVECIFYSNANISTKKVDNYNFISGHKVEKIEQLPDEYEQLDYIESSGEQYIDTGLPVHMNYHYYIDYQRTETTQTRIWGAYNQSTYNGGMNASLTYACGDTIRWTVSGDSNQLVQEINNKTTCDTNRHKVEIINGSVYCDGVYKGISAGHDPTAVTKYNAYLFTANPGGDTTSYILVGKIYSYKVWNENDVLVQDFIPCVRKSDGVVGFYDLVYDEFYTNVSINEINSATTSFETGDYVGHTFDDGKVIKEATLDEDGVIEYSCIYCGHAIREKIRAIAYSIDFQIDDGVEYVRVYNSIDPSDFEDTLFTHARNNKTYNYSRYNAVVRFEVIFKEGYSIDKIKNCVVSQKDNIYTTKYINKNTTIIIKSKQT